MNFRFSIITSVLLIAAIFAGCNPKGNELIVAEFENGKISLDEFEKAYAKNVGGEENVSTDSTTKMENFLNLYTNFKMKLRDAEVRGLTKDPDLVAELIDYKKKIGKAFIEEKEIYDPNIRKIYEMKKEEIRLQHFMLRLDTIERGDAVRKARQIIEKLNSGARFDSLARLYSDDQFSKNRGGDISYITAGTIIPEFEVAAYATKNGEVYQIPINTMYGVHVLKVTDRRAVKYKIRIKHILIKTVNEEKKHDTLYALNKIKDIKEQIANGGSFEELAKKYSDDTGSAAKGGDLGFKGRRETTLDFDLVAFDLPINEVSDIVKTQHGYHLIKVTEIQPFPKYDELKDELTKSYKKGRINQDRMKYTNSIKEDFQIKFDTVMINQISKWSNDIEIQSISADSNYVGLNNKPLVFSKDQSISIDSVLSFSVISKIYPNLKGTRKNLIMLCNKFSDVFVYDRYALVYDKENLEFAEIMDEYKRGVYIFKLQEEEIWDKIKIDSIAISKYYNQNKDSFKWGDRVNYDFIFSVKEEAVIDLYNKLNSGEEFSTTKLKDNSDALQNEHKSSKGFVNKDFNELSKLAYQLEKSGDYTKPIKLKDGFGIVSLIEKQSSAQKTLQEAKSEIINLLQEKEAKRLEDEYLKKLNKIYKPEFHNDVLSNAFKKSNN